MEKEERIKLKIIKEGYEIKSNIRTSC